MKRARRSLLIFYFLLRSGLKINRLNEMKVFLRSHRSFCSQSLFVCYFLYKAYPKNDQRYFFTIYLSYFRQKKILKKNELLLIFKHELVTIYENVHFISFRKSSEIKKKKVLNRKQSFSEVMGHSVHGSFFFYMPYNLKMTSNTFITLISPILDRKKFL